MRKTKTLWSAAIMAGALSLTGVAWACTAQLGMKAEPRKGVAGSVVTVEGDGAPGPVEIRWNSVDGPVIGRSADGTTFAVALTVPEVDPGVYTMVAVNQNGDGVPTARGQAAFEVTSAGAEAIDPSSSQAWSASSTEQAAPQSPAKALGIGLLSVGLLAMASFAVILKKRKAFAGAGALRQRQTR